jgi:hypothetical protein
MRCAFSSSDIRWSGSGSRDGFSSMLLGWQTNSRVTPGLDIAANNAGSTASRAWNSRNARPNDLSKSENREPGIKKFQNLYRHQRAPNGPLERVLSRFAAAIAAKDRIEQDVSGEHGASNRERIVSVAVRAGGAACAGPDQQNDPDNQRNEHYERDREPGPDTTVSSPRNAPVNGSDEQDHGSAGNRHTLPAASPGA